MKVLGVYVLAAVGIILSAALCVIGKIIYDYFKGR